MNKANDEAKPKRGAPEGNKNAAKEETLEAVLSFKCGAAEKGEWVRKARARGVKLSVWVRARLNEADQ